MAPRIALLFALMASVAIKGLAGASTLMPPPKSLLPRPGQFALNRPVTVVADTVPPMLWQFLDQAALTAAAAADSAGAVLTVATGCRIAGAADYRLDGFPNEAYSLTVGPDTIAIRAAEPMGVTRAAQTLMLLADDNPDAIDCADIADWPAFKLRGFMHDVGRSFITIDELKKQIDLLSRFKVNTFHWHLTENQAWRLQSLRFPQLTAAEAMTRQPGLFYTQQQCRELSRYAHDRGVIVIPEVDMPGHSAAFARAMGFDMQTDPGVDALKLILAEVADCFPYSPYIHIGGDEVAITYPGFLKTMLAEVKKLNRKAVLWNPIQGVDVAGLDVDMVQLWGAAGRKVAGKANIDCRYNYINHFDTFADLAAIYNSSIYYSAQGSEEIAGEIAACWNDRQLPDQAAIVRQNNLYANVLAAAERAWVGGQRPYIEQGGATLAPGSCQLREFADWERRFLHHRERLLRNEPIPYVAQSNVVWRITTALPGGDSTVVADAAGAAVYLNHTWGRNVPGLFPDAPKGATAFASTYIFSPQAQDAAALIEFQNYSRSERDLAPRAGQWDRKGSRLWLNGVEILAPDWQNAGRLVNHETLLRDENLAARPPVAIRLQKGWNHVIVKLPYADAPGVRLNKWMFTFVVVTPDGRSALPGITYSPTLP